MYVELTQSENVNNVRLAMRSNYWLQCNIEIWEKFKNRLIRDGSSLNIYKQKTTNEFH